MYNEKYKEYLSCSCILTLPDWGMKSAMALGCRAGLTSYIGLRAGTTICRHSRFHPLQSETKNRASVQCAPLQIDALWQKGYFLSLGCFGHNN